MSPEAAVLGLLSAVRAVPLAIVYGLLLDDRPRRLLAAYLGAGLVVSLGAGTAVLALFGGSTRSTDATTGRLLIDLLLGITALVAAVVSRHERFGRSARPAPAPSERPPRGVRRLGGALQDALRAPTVSAAGAAGAVTNLPGVFYLAGLVAILETHPTPAGGVVQVLIYNALRFALPALALLLVVVRPARTATTVRAVHGWGTRHRRDLVTGVLGLVGAYLVLKAVAGLLA